MYYSSLGGSVLRRGCLGHEHRQWWSRHWREGLPGPRGRKTLSLYSDPPRSVWGPCLRWEVHIVGVQQP